MAFPAYPFNLHCRDCGWTIHCQPDSDCFTADAAPSLCKRCGSAELEAEYGKNLRFKAFLRTKLGVI